MMEENQVLLETLKEIPDTLTEILMKREMISKDFVSLFKEKRIKKIYFSGQASGIYLGLMFKKFIEANFEIEVQVVNPAAFLQNERFNVNGVYRPDELCMICPAHSGSTTGPVEMAGICRKQGISVVCTTYDVNSKLAKLSDVVIYKYSGPEESYIEAKGHFASMMCIFVCFLEWGRKTGKIFRNVYETYISQLWNVVENMSAVIEDARKWYAGHKAILLHTPYIRYVANGEYEGAILEGALKIAESAHIACVFYETEEFMHRSTTQIDRDSVIMITAPPGDGFERNLELEDWSLEYCENVILLTSKSSKLERPDIFKITSAEAPFFSTMEYMLAFETLAYELCEDLNQSLVKASNDGASKKLNTHIAG